jgi:hypothetical protein
MRRNIYRHGDSNSLVLQRQRLGAHGLDRRDVLQRSRWPLLSPLPHGDVCISLWGGVVCLTLRIRI